jgi:hypothetical protein
VAGDSEPDSEPEAGVRDRRRDSAATRAFKSIKLSLRPRPRTESAGSRPQAPPNPGPQKPRLQPEATALAPAGNEPEVHRLGLCQPGWSRRPEGMPQSDGSIDRTQGYVPRPYYGTVLG